MELARPAVFLFSYFCKGKLVLCQLSSLKNFYDVCLIQQGRAMLLTLKIY